MIKQKIYQSSAEIIEKIKEIEVVDSNPAIITETKEGDNFVKSTTYKEPKITKVTYNIAELQAKIDKYDGVIAQWEAKKKPLQAIIDKYNQL